MKKRTVHFMMVIFCSVLIATYSSGLIEAVEVPGITKDQILVGAYMGYSSPGAAAIIYNVDAGCNTYLNSINEQGGIYGRRIKWITEDDSYQPAKTIAACKKLVEKDNIFAMLSAFGAPTTLAAIPYLAEQKVLSIGPFSPVVGTEVPFRPYVFTITPVDQVQYYFMVGYFIKELGAKRIATVYQSGPGKFAAEAIEYRVKEAGLTLAVDSAEYTVGQADFSAIITKFKAETPT